jgi:uncharacterized membrane protein YeiB
MNDVLLIALGSYAIVTALRLLAGRYDDRIAMRSNTKFILVLVAATGLAFLVNESATTDITDAVAEGLAGAGLATVIHRTHRWLGAMGDLYRLHVMNGARGR